MSTIKQNILKTLGIILMGISLSQCDLIEYHPYDTDLEEEYEDLNQKCFDVLAKQDQTNDTLRFIFMGDTQRWYDETEDFVNAANQRNDIDFVVHGGDISDFGMKEEFMWIHDIMKKLNVPYFALPGNHDILGNGEDIYKEMYGDLNFNLIYKRTKLLCLNTNALEFDITTPVPDLEYIQNATADSLDNTYDRSVAIMHVPPGDIEFNNNVAEPFHQYIKAMKGLKFCLHAHAHRLMENDFFNDGMIYYGCDDMEDKNYMVFTLIGDTYEYEVVYY